jgi:predicted AlkP superfamily pyrophosphatase or phosphodiesterase
LPQLRTLCSGLEGVAAVHDGEDGPQFGMPTPQDHQGMGDLILFAKEGYAFQAAVDGDDPVVPTTTYLGTHGYINTDPELDGIFLAWGHGVKAGAQLPRVSNLDIAPTLARLLNVEMPPMDGRVLTELLVRP